MIKLLTYAPVSVDQTDDVSIDVYMSFVYQTDDKLPTCTRVFFYHTDETFKAYSLRQ